MEHSVTQITRNIIDWFIEEVLKKEKLSVEQKIQIAIDIAKGLNYLQVKKPFYYENIDSY